MGSQATSNLLAPLLVARVPAWERVSHTDYLTSPPIEIADGLDSLSGDVPQGSPRTHLLWSTTRRTDRRTGYVYITALDTTDTYTITVDTVAYAYDADAGGATSIADVLDGLFTVIEAAAPATFDAYKVTAGDGSSETIALRIESTPSGDSAAPSSMVFDAAPAVSGGSGGGVIQINGEVTLYAFALWALAARGRSDGPPDSGQWFELSTYTVTTTPQRDFLNTAGLARLAVEVQSFTPFPGDHASILPAFYIHVGYATDETAEV